MSYNSPDEPIHRATGAYWYCCVPPPDPDRSFTVGVCGSGLTPQNAYSMWFMLRYPPMILRKI